MYESDDEQSKRVFTVFCYHESNNNNNIENDDSATLYVCKVCCLKKPYNKPLINLDCLVIAGKYQTSVFYVRSSPYGFGLYYQDLGLIFSRNDRTFG